jgi:hypothetical protein
VEAQPITHMPVSGTTPTFENGGPTPMPVPAPGPAPSPMVNMPKSPGFFENITIMDVGIVALVSLALYYSIYSSRVSIKFYQKQTKQNSSEIAAIKAQIKTISGGA